MPGPLGRPIPLSLPAAAHVAASHAATTLPSVATLPVAAAATGAITTALTQPPECALPAARAARDGGANP